MRLAPLPRFSADELAPVLEEEVRCWRRELTWDYRASARAISRCLNSRSLQGHVLSEPRGEAAGYCYHLIDGAVGYIGNFFVRRRHATPEAYRRLLEATLADLREGGRVDRIECQFVPFNCEVAELFVAEGFTAVHRRFMVRGLEADDSGRAEGADGNLVAWTAAYLRSAAQVILDSYRSSTDFDLCADYQSRRGVLRFLRNLIENSGCGDFCARSSLVGVDSADGAAQAVLLSSRIAPKTHMIPQVSVDPAHQNRGWGTAMLRGHFALAAREGSTRTVLCVSDRNEGAVRLYRRLGFEDRKRFHAFIWKAP